MINTFYFVLNRYAKGHWTQLQFIFESVDVSEHFSFGIKLTYRGYSQSKVIEIVPNKESVTDVKFKAINT